MLDNLEDMKIDVGEPKKSAVWLGTTILVVTFIGLVIFAFSPLLFIWCEWPTVWRVGLLGLVLLFAPIFLLWGTYQIIRILTGKV